jgi:thiamine pyrophosphate-dependent acetolactate synthase large subunit-like protein
VSPIKPQAVIEKLSELTADRKEKTIITTGVGQHQMERSVTIDVDDEAVGTGHLGSKSCGETVTHSTETTGGQGAPDQQ